MDAIPAELRHEGHEEIEAHEAALLDALRPIRWIAASLCLLLTVACSAPPPFENTYTSPEALARDVLEAIRAGDRGRLEAIALNEGEFEAHVWPDLPAARPERNLPMSFVWGDLHQKSRLALAATLKRQSGRRYELRKVTFGATTPYPRYRVHRESVFHVRDETGRETGIRVSGSMIEKDGGWKVFSYVID